MKRLIQHLMLTAIAAVLLAAPARVLAQGRGNFDPAQARARMMDRYRQGLEITNDDEWKVIETLVGKVMDARREVGGGGFGGGRRRGGGNGGGTAAGTGTGTTGGNAGGTADAQAAGNGGQGGGRGGFNRPPNPEADALQSALDSKASSDELKAKLSKFREARKEKEAKLQAAQDDLRKVLTVRQEAAAVLAGLLQ